jgi:hypothetical protein
LARTGDIVKSRRGGAWEPLSLWLLLDFRESQSWARAEPPAKAFNREGRRGDKSRRDAYN